MLGNDVADRLAKEAATEAKELGEEKSIVTVQDVKRHARVSIRYKLQQRWDIGESGRDFYLYKPFLKSNPRLDYPNIKLYKKTTLQLRTGYSKLNGYRHKLGQVETRYCECVQIETVQHYLLECPLYDEARYTLLKRLREELGIQAPYIYTLLGYDRPLEFPNWRELICEEVGHFIERTERFKEMKEQIIASQ